MNPENQFRPHPDWPLVVAYGLGVNSTAMLVEFARRSITLNLILFADTGGEKPETCAYMPTIQRYLAGVSLRPGGDRAVDVRAQVRQVRPVPEVRGGRAAWRSGRLVRVRA